MLEKTTSKTDDLSDLVNKVKKTALEIYKELGAGYDKSTSIELRDKNIPYGVGC